MDPSRLLKPWIASTVMQAFESHAKNRTVTKDGELAISCSSKKYVQLLEIVETQEKQASIIFGAVSDTNIRVEAQFTETCHRNFLNKHKKLLKSLQGAVFELSRFHFVLNGCDGKLYENGITFAEQTRNQKFSSNSTKPVSGNGKTIPVTSLPSPSLRLIIEDCTFRPSPAGKPSKPVSNTKKHPELEKLLRSLPRKPQPVAAASNSKQTEVGVEDKDKDKDEDSEGWGSQVEDLPPLKSRSGPNKPTTKKSTTSDIYAFPEDEDTQGFATQAFGTQLPYWKPVKKSPIRTYSKKGQPQPRSKETGTRGRDDKTKSRNDDDSEDWDSDIERIITPRDQQALLDREEESLYPPVGSSKHRRGRELKPAFRQHVPRIRNMPAPKEKEPTEPDFPSSSPVESRKAEPTGEPIGEPAGKGELRAPSRAPPAASQKAIPTAPMAPKAPQFSSSHPNPAPQPIPSTPPRTSQRPQDPSSDPESEAEEDAVPWSSSPVHPGLPSLRAKASPSPSNQQSQSVQHGSNTSASIQPGQRNPLLSSRELDQGRWSETEVISPQVSKVASVGDGEDNEDNEDEEGWSEEEMLDPVRLSQASQSQACNFDDSDSEDGQSGDKDKDQDRDDDEAEEEKEEEAMRFQSQLPPQAASHNRYLHSVPRPESRLYNETGSDQIGFTATPAGASQFRFNPVATPKMVLSSEADIDDDEGTQKPILHTPGSVLEKAAKEWASTPVESKKTSTESPNKTTDADQTTPEHIGEVSLDYDPGSETEVDEGDEAEGEAEGDEVEDNKDDEDTQRPFLSSTPDAAKPPIRSSSTTPKAHPQHQTPRSRLSLPIPLPASERPEIDASFTSHDSFSNELEPHFLPTPRKPVGPTLSSSAPAYLPSASSDLDSEIFSSPPPVPPVPSSSAKPAKPANPEKLEGLAKLRNSILGKPSKWKKKDKKAKKAKGKEGPPITYRAAVKKAHPGPRGGVEEEEDGDDGDGQESRGKNEHTEELGTKVTYKLKAAYKRASSGPRPAFSTNSDDDDEEEEEDEEELPTRGQKMQSVVVEKMRASQVLQYARNETLGTLEIQQMRMKRKAEMEKDKEIQNKRMKDADEEVQRRDTEENPESSGEEENSEEGWDSDIEIGVPPRTQRAEEEKEKEGEQEEESEKEDTRSAMSLDKASAEAQPTPNQEAVEEIFEDSYKSTIAETQFETQGPLPAARSQSMTRPQRPGFSDDENDDEDIPCAPAMPLSGSSMGSLFGPTPKASGQPAPVSSAAPTVLQPMATANKQPQPEIQVHATPPKAAQHHPHSPIPGSQLSQHPLSQQQQQPLAQSVVPSTQPQPQPPQSPSTTRKRPPSSSILTTPPVLKKTKTSPKKTPPSATSLRMAKILDGIPVPGSRRSSEAFGTPRELLLPKRNVMGEVEKAGKDTETGEIELDIVMKSPEKIKEMPILDVSPQKKRELSQQSQQGQPNQQRTPPPRPPAPPTIKRAERAERASSESQIQAQLDAQLASDIFLGSQQGPESQEQEQGHAEQEQEQQHEPDSQYYSIPRSYDVSDSDEDNDGEDGDQDVSWRSQNVGMVGETTGEITEGVTEDFTKAIQEDVTGVTEYTEDTQSSVQQPSQVEKYMEVSTEVEVSMEEAEEAISSAEGVSSAKTDAAVEEEEADPMEEDVAHIIQATEAASDNPNAPSFEAPTTTPVLTADLAVELDFAMLQSPPLSPPESPNRSQSDTLTLLAAISDSQIPSDAPNTSNTNDASTASDPPGAEPVQPELDSHLRPRRIRVPGYSTFTAEQQAELESRRARWFGIQPGARVRIRSVEKQMEVNERFRAEVAEREEAREREREGIMQNTQGREEREWFKDENTPFKKFVRSWEGLKAVRMEREKAMEVAREEGEVMSEER